MPHGKRGSGLDILVFEGFPGTSYLFFVLYILLGVFMFIFIPMIIDIVDTIYSNPTLVLEITQLTLVNFVRQYFGLIILGIYITSGIIIYAKPRILGSTQ